MELQKINKYNWSFKFTKRSNWIDYRIRYFESQREELDKNKIKLFNVGSKFVPTGNRKRSYYSTKHICALHIEQEEKLCVAELLRQNISRILTKDLRKKKH